MAKLNALDPVVKFRLEHVGDHYDLYTDGFFLACLGKYAQIVSKSRPSTYEQVLIGEVFALLESASKDYDARSLRLGFLSRKVYNDLKATFRRSRKAGEAKALALARKLYFDDYNRLLQTRAWTEVGGSSGVLKVRIKGYCYSLRFSDGVDSVTVECGPVLLADHFSLFWCFKAWKIKELISLLNKFQLTEFTPSIRGVEKERLLKALEVALRHDTTLGAALFLIAKE